MAITAAQVKELREMTGAGMMDCKKALTACEGDMDAAVDWLRKNGAATAQKKEGRTAAEGLTRVRTAGNTGVVIEINSETDFVAKNELFLELLDKTTDAILNNKPATMEEALALPVDGGTLNDAIINAIGVIREKIAFRRFEVVEKADDELFGTYMHMGGTISGLVVVKGTDKEEVAANMAMQVVSMSPTYISRDYMPQDVVEHERMIQTDIVNNDPKLKDKPEKVKLGAIEGKVSKSLQEMCLVDQIFFLDQNIKCKQYLKEQHAEVTKFVRFKVGEGIEKVQTDFAAEVAAMAK
ncbi:MAG: elongation factor Ts [Solobacterium sp.]|nr:elongation factor Ts [Erysipelotrichaceae bacterium]MBQ1325380.1 elongation factor Ts [Solobacterium sp.]MBQ1447160.1 elongation factor Ts [Solobacterium sp.]MBQ2690090.1 elongation factor Ts [Solobacterium sp.]MBQ6592627.1 elongation factor Ts [Solobacterium sp.]